MKVFYSKHERTIVIAIFAFIVGAGVGLITKIEKDPLELIVPSIATLFAAFFGAWYAFRLQSKKEEEKLHKQNIEAANRALFTLSRIINELEVVKKQVIDPVREREERFLVMLPFLIPNYDDVKFKIESLTFLLESKHPNILGELIVEETRFHQAISSLYNRSELHRHQVQPILEAAGVRIGGQYRMEDFQDALGERLFVQIQIATNNLIEHVDETLKTSDDLMKRFVSTMKKIYPKSDFVTLKRHEEPNNAPQSDA